MWQFSFVAASEPTVAVSVMAEVESPQTLPEKQSAEVSQNTAAWPETVDAMPAAVPRPTAISLPPDRPEPLIQPPAPSTVAESGLPQPVRAIGGHFPARPEAQPATSAQPEPAPAMQEPPTKPRAEGPVQAIANPHIPPQILTPAWPRSVREGFSGTVLVEVIVGLDGKATSADIVEGTGRESWDEALLEVFQNARYSVGTHYNQPVVSSHRFRVTFRQR